MKNEIYKIVSLFSGCGGFDLGFIQEGFNVVWANDFDERAASTYRHNIGNHIVHGDISKIKSSEIPNNFDVLLAGFPCQGFSVSNTKRSMSDKRNFLYLEVLRILKDKKPKFFVCENVKGLLSIQKGKVIQMILQDFRSLGYKVDFKVLKASDYGVPQNRERVIIIGNCIGLENPFPKISHGEKGHLPYITVEKAIGKLADVRLQEAPFHLGNELIYNHVARTNVSDMFWKRKHDVSQKEICDYLKLWKSKSSYSVKKLDKLFGYRHTAGHWFRSDHSGAIPSPKDWWNLKKVLGFDDKYDAQVTELEQKEITFSQSLRISNWNEPSDTITATGPEIHPNKQRRLSVRECAILQTFPNNFVFLGSLSSMYKQIGNAVPVLLSRRIANLLKTKLDNYEY